MKLRYYSNLTFCQLRDDQSGVLPISTSCKDSAHHTPAKAAPLHGSDRAGLASEAAPEVSARKQRVVNLTQLFHLFTRKFH